MALSGSTLDGLIYTAVLAELNTQFGPDIAGLAAPGQAKIQADFSKIAHCVAKAAEAIVSHITGSAEVVATGTDPQGGSVNSTGTVS